MTSTTTSNKNWQGTTYGNTFMHRWLIRMLRIIPIWILYIFTAIFVIPVCLMVNPATKMTYRYFRRQWQMSPLCASLKTYYNFYLFAQVVIDKFAMYAGKRFDISIEGYDHFQRLADEKEGFMVLSAHIGNYEIAGYTLRAKQKRFNALVFAQEKASVMQNRNKMFQQSNICMIPVMPDMSHIFQINNALADGEIVSMPADRLHGSQKGIDISFLNGQATLPYGPFNIAVMRSVNCLAVNVMKTGIKTYRIYITPLSYDKHGSRQQQIAQLSKAYISELERLLRIYPAQWYNYFEFWN